MTERSQPTATDHLEQATAATLRTLAESAEVQVDFGADHTQVSEHHVKLLSSASFQQTDTLPVFRGIADSAGLRLRYHQPEIHSRYLPAHAEARKTFDRLEKIRCEALGARRLNGVAKNLQATLEAHYQNLDVNLQQLWLLPLSEILPLLLWESLTAAPLSRDLQQIVQPWRERIDDSVLSPLVDNINDQEQYARNSIQLLQSLKLNVETEPEQEAEASPQQPQDEDSETDVEQEINTVTLEPERLSESPWRPDEKLPEIQDSYRAFTTQFDEVIGAEDLLSAAELARLRTSLDQQLQPLQGLVTRLANRLQRRLLALQQHDWEFDLDEGMLDARRLSQIVMHPLTPLSFKQEKSGEFRDTVVTLLIDNSRSMKGWPISIAAMGADIIARTLERCGVRVEILGFTTRSWKSGQSGALWERSGKSKNPGRLNDLRHIVYKSADIPWRRARNHLALMMRIDILKQNVDGEALLWAHQRLLARAEQRRILIVISDGVPVDELTLAVNHKGFLDQHLRQVIGWIEQQSPVQLRAIGIGHDVTRYYRQSIMIETPEQFSVALVDQLDSLFV